MNRLFAILDKSIYYAIGSAFLFLFILNSVQIILRSFTSYSLLWSVDLSKLIIVWIVFMGATIAVYRHDHLLIEFIKKMFPAKVEITIDLFTRCLLLTFFVVLIVTGIEVTQVRMGIPYTILGWPTGYAYLAVPVSGCFMVVFTLEKIYRLILSLRKPTKESRL